MVLDRAQNYSRAHSIRVFKFCPQVRLILNLYIELSIKQYNIYPKVFYNQKLLIWNIAHIYVTNHLIKYNNSF